MRMGAILNDVVDRLGVGKDGLFKRSALFGISTLMAAAEVSVGVPLMVMTKVFV